MQNNFWQIGELVVHPTRTESSAIRDHLKGLQIFDGYATEIDPLLDVMNLCRRWLPDDIGGHLGNLALQQHEAIYSVVSHYGSAHLPEQFRSLTGLDSVTDAQAIASFALANAICALCGLADHLQHSPGDSVSALEYYRMHLDCIDECLASDPNATLSPTESTAFQDIRDLAATTSSRVGDKIHGVMSGATRRNESAERDRDIYTKGLELLTTGTRYHNLNSKLRTWQERETGKIISKVQMYSVMKRVGLDRFNPSSSLDRKVK